MAITISTTKVEENSTGTIATLSGAASYRIEGGADVLATFDIVGGNLVVKDGAVLDYETRKAFDFQIKGLDAEGNEIGSLDLTGDHAFTIKDVNEAPDSVTIGGKTTLTIAEDLPVGSIIGILDITDPEDDGILGCFLESEFFEIVRNYDGTFALTLKAPLDYEKVTELVLEIAPMDINGNVRVGSDDKPSGYPITIKIANVNEYAPTDILLDGSDTVAVAESATAITVGTLSATDWDGDTLTYMIVDENGEPATDSLFEIRVVEDDDGVPQHVLVSREGILVTSTTSYYVYVKVSDGFGHSPIQKFTVTVQNVNHKPTDILLSNDKVIEHPADGTVIGVLAAVDEDQGDTFVYTFEDDFDGRFEIQGDKLVVKDGSRLEKGQTYQIHVFARDSGENGLWTDKTLTITVERDNHAPTDITLSGSRVLEGAANGTEIGLLSAMDPDLEDKDGPFTFTLVGEASGAFAIEDGKLVVKDGSKLDYETSRTHEITVRVTDQGGAHADKTLTITVGDVLETVPGATKGKDVLKGGIGADKLNGGYGNDVLTGGAGADIFVFDSKLGTAKTDRKVNFDTITDFSVGEDKIWLDNAVFKKLGKGTELAPGKLNKAFFVTGTKAKDKNDYLIYDKKTGILSYDADGSGKGQAVEFAKLSKNLKLSVNDFLIV